MDYDYRDGEGISAEYLSDEGLPLVSLNLLFPMTSIIVAVIMAAAVGVIALLEMIKQSKNHH